MGPWGTEETWGKHYLIWLGLGPGCRTWPKLRLGLASEEARRVKETRKKGRRSLEAAILLTLVLSLNKKRPTDVYQSQGRDFDPRETSSCNTACWSSTDLSTYTHNAHNKRQWPTMTLSTSDTSKSKLDKSEIGQKHIEPVIISQPPNMFGSFPFGSKLPVSIYIESQGLSAI